jgi:mannose-6-phosphate isomerase-like protein (cupin superfamily)
MLGQGYRMFIECKDVSAFTFDGLTIRDYTASTNCGSSIAVVDVLPGISHKLAFSKRSDKYYFVVTGEITFCIENETRRLGTGDIAIVPKGICFSYQNDSQQRASLLLVHSPKFDLAAEVFVD